MLVPGGNAFRGFSESGCSWWAAILSCPLLSLMGSGYPDWTSTLLWWGFHLPDLWQDQRTKGTSWTPHPLFLLKRSAPTISSKVVLFLWNLSRWPLTHLLDHFKSAFFGGHPRACWVWKSHVPLLLNRLLCPSLTKSASLCKEGNNLLFILANASALGCHLCSHGCSCCINPRFLWSLWSCSLPLPVRRHILQV